MGFFHDLNDNLLEMRKIIKQFDESLYASEIIEKHHAIQNIITSMIDSPILWERYCPFNIHDTGRRLGEYIENCKNDVDFYIERIDTVFYLFIRFFVEYYLSLSRNNHEIRPTSPLYKLIEKLKKAAFYDENYEKNQLITFAFYQMPLEILNFYIGSPGFQTFVNFDSKKEELENSISKHTQEVESKISEVEKLKTALDEYKTAYNFVGLSDGFQKLLDKKDTAKWWTFAGLVTLLLATFIPLGFSFYKFIDDKTLSWEQMLPVIGLEFVLIYFFRVVLSHYHAIQTQIMQLELRQSLCQFIQSYADYAKEIKASDKDALEKFENLIFSSILSNPDKVPGTFDGIDSLTTLLKEFKK
ncbi:hypothetical protein [Neisseria zoodegmatis]|uniref:Uncharacterized protein n=2 Tax=Neisseria zoodegmatis TaxID=326523 RepID=A0AB38DPF7_9NEIS|nr:hypothetical protein [Neisseria zoodegmatis]SNU79117.1 Uncharacterised protein [Neisseria zoodegmatis]